MLEVKDEILEGEPRYRIRDKNNNIINDDVLIERTTPVLQEGTPVNKALFDKIISFLVPSGLICMWSGSIVPNGWFLCNGENGTPDLRNRFIVGAGTEYNIGDVGGEKTHVLTIDEIPSHTHNYSVVDEKMSSSPLNTAEDFYKNVKNATTSATGGGKAHENRPPYYALAYIMKG